MSRFVPNFEELYRQLGTLIVTWGYLEASAGRLLAGILGPPHDERSTLFFSVVSNQARIDMLQMALKASTLDPETNKEATRLVAKFQSLNKARNKYVHASYGTAGLTEAGHIMWSDSTKPTRMPNGDFCIAETDDLNGSEIPNHCEAARELSRRMNEFARSSLGVPKTVRLLKRAQPLPRKAQTPRG